MKSFADRRVFITGGSSGIGKAIARQLVAEGAHVCIAARRQEALDEAARDLRSAARSGAQRVETLSLDIADREAVSRLGGEVLARLGGLDLLINNAGVAHPAAFVDTPEEVFESMMRVNYFGTVNVTRALLPHLVKERGGHIAIVSSLAGVLGIYGYSAYAASKFALWGLADCLRQELIAHDIGVSVVFPPDTDTPQLAAENEIKPAETKAVAGNVKVMSPAEVARATLEGIRARRYHIVPGAESKLTYFMVRHFPGVVRWFIDGDLRKFQRGAAG